MRCVDYDVIDTGFTIDSIDCSPSSYAQKLFDFLDCRQCLSGLYSHYVSMWFECGTLSASMVRLEDHCHPLRNFLV